MSDQKKHTRTFMTWAAGEKDPGPPTLDLPPNPELTAAGWERRFMADPARLEEAVRLYQDLGFEVHIEQIEPAELSEICGDCRLATCFAYKTIYTRKTRFQD